MPTYVTLAEYTQQGIENIDESPHRIEEFREIVESNGGEITDYHVTMGEYDVVMVTEFPDAETAARVLLTVGREGNVSTETLTAFSEEEFGDLVAELP